MEKLNELTNHAKDHQKDIFFIPSIEITHLNKSSCITDTPYVMPSHLVEKEHLKRD